VRLLLDTHALIWWIGGDEKLGSAAQTAIADAGNEILISAVSAMEITTKHRLGKLAEAERLAQNFEAIIEEQGFVSLSISIRHASLAGSLQISHKDPFDRLLIAQSIVENLTLVTNETVFDDFGVSRLW
jgi:PIN domain nuclease of toxin-antitoxin system